MWFSRMPTVRTPFSQLSLEGKGGQKKGWVGDALLVVALVAYALVVLVAFAYTVAWALSG